ncbi:MAG: hypothetical protein H7257_09460 [Taibaiella sp.]|nr:hypothetical protein [Taibaiella sp.]
MKRILLSCFLITAACAGTIQKAHAQSSAVSVAAFTAKVNLLDSFIFVGDMTHANTTWTEVHNMLLAELAVTKGNIASASSAAASTSYTTVMNNQYSIYNVIWSLKADLATNRAALHTKLNDFAATF